MAFLKIPMSLQGFRNIHLIGKPEPIWQNVRKCSESESRSWEYNAVPKYSSSGEFSTENSSGDSSKGRPEQETF